MDFINKVAGDGDNKSSDKQEGSSGGGGGGGGGFMDTINSFAGGGKQGEKNEDGLDKAVDMAQEKVLGQGDQSNESAAEQAKDEAISDFIRDKYQETTGKEFFVEDKDKKYGA